MMMMMMMKISILVGIANAFKTEPKMFEDQVPLLGNNTGTGTMLKVSQLQIDPHCIMKNAVAEQVAIKVVAPSVKDCVGLCRNNYDGQCNVLLWKRDHWCFLTTFYSLNGCFSSLLYTTNYVLMVNVSITAPISVKRKLLAYGMRNQIKSLLNCEIDEYMCDDWTCVQNKWNCNGSYDCRYKPYGKNCMKSKSEAECVGANGLMYDAGEKYMSFEVMGQCQLCKCGNATLCTSMVCDNRNSCENQPMRMCCYCGDPRNTIPDERRLYLRLIFSLLFVFIILLIVVYWRYPRANWRSRDTTSFFLGHAPSPSRPPQQRFSRDTGSVSFYNGNGIPIQYSDNPPPYSSVKPVDQASIPPPSYVSRSSSPSHRSALTYKEIGEAFRFDQSDEENSNQPIGMQISGDEICERRSALQHADSSDSNQPSTCASSNDPASKQENTATEQR